MLLILFHMRMNGVFNHILHHLLSQMQQTINTTYVNQKKTNFVTNTTEKFRSDFQLVWTDKK